jgi:4-hydroxythreonine-4-phosphate dehydrogenase
MKPKLLITLGDVAGIGPEIVVKAWEALHEWCEPTVIGDSRFLPESISVYNPSLVNLSMVPRGVATAEAGQAAYDWLCYAIDECVAGRADGVVTCPIHKVGFQLAGLDFPGHTEVLAARTGAPAHAMLLYDDALPLAVAHVTLHQELAQAVASLTTEGVMEKIQLLADMIPQLCGQQALIGVGALNPHGSDGGRFGDAEARIIAPAVAIMQQRGLVVEGPIPADAIFLPSTRSRFNGIVCMIHDHGHIPMKLLGGRRAVNVTAGLPIVRTSVAHGTAYDIVGTGLADESSLIAATRVAAQLATLRKKF